MLYITQAFTHNSIIAFSVNCGFVFCPCNFPVLWRQCQPGKGALDVNAHEQFSIIAQTLTGLPSFSFPNFPELDCCLYAHIIHCRKSTRTPGMYTRSSCLPLPGCSTNPQAPTGRTDQLPISDRPIPSYNSQVACLSSF